MTSRMRHPRTALGPPARNRALANGWRQDYMLCPRCGTRWPSLIRIARLYTNCPECYKEVSVLRDSTDPPLLELGIPRLRDDED